MLGTAIVMCVSVLSGSIVDGILGLFRASLRDSFGDLTGSMRDSGVDVDSLVTNNKCRVHGWYGMSVMISRRKLSSS